MPTVSAKINPKEYECGIIIPDDATGEEDDRITKESYNRSRRILGFEEISEL